MHDSKSRISRFKPRLTYANAMATIAVFVVLGGSAYAAHSHKIATTDLQNGAVSAKKMKQGAVKPKKIASGAVKVGKLDAPLRPRFAVVQANGSLDRGRGVVDSGQLPGDGQYIVTFNRDISDCAYIATRGSHVAADTSAATPGMVMVASVTDDTNSVRVGTRNGFTDANADLAFHLQVVC